MPRSNLNNSRALPGYIFQASAATIQECFKRRLFGAPHDARGSVGGIRSGKTLLFLYHIGTRELHGIFVAASNGGVDLVHKAWRGRYPAQVRVKEESERCPPLPRAAYKHVVGSSGGRGRFVPELSLQQTRKLVELFRRVKAAKTKPDNGNNGNGNGTGRNSKANGAFTATKKKASASVHPLDRALGASRDGGDVGGSSSVPSANVGATVAALKAGIASGFRAGVGAGAGAGVQGSFVIDRTGARPVRKTSASHALPPPKQKAAAIPSSSPPPPGPRYAAVAHPAPPTLQGVAGVAVAKRSAADDRFQKTTDDGRAAAAKGAAAALAESARRRAREVGFDPSGTTCKAARGCKRPDCYFDHPGTYCLCRRQSTETQVFGVMFADSKESVLHFQAVV